MNITLSEAIESLDGAQILDCLAEARAILEFLETARAVLADKDASEEERTEAEEEAELYEPDEDDAREVVEKLGQVENEIGRDSRLIPEYAFEDYARELAEDCSNIPEGWPCNCIDWELAARELSHDYSMVTIDGEDYYTLN